MREEHSHRQDEAQQAKLDTILHPSTTAQQFLITIEFGYKASPHYAKAVDIAKRQPSYKEKGSGEWTRHSATFEPEDVEELFALFNIVHDWDSTEILVNHKKIPYGHQLWLPLMWFNRIK